MTLHLCSPGRPTPYGPRPDGAALTIGPDPLTLLVSLSRPTPAEVSELRRGRLRVGLTEPAGPGGAALMAWRFEPLAPRSPGLWLDTPFHIGLNPPAGRCLEPRAPHQHRTVLVVVQDEAARFRGGRMITLSPDLCAVFEAIVEAQAKAAANPGWTYDDAVDRALARWPDPQSAMRDAVVAEVAGLSRWTGRVEVRDGHAA